MARSMERLFAEVSDARALIRAKELYDLLKNPVDSCRVGDVIHVVVLDAYDRTSDGHVVLSSGPDIRLLISMCRHSMP